MAAFVVYAPRSSLKLRGFFVFEHSGVHKQKAEPNVSKGSALLYCLRPAARAGLRSSHYLDVRSLRALLALRCNEGNALIFGKRFVSAALDLAEVREKVLAAGFRHDEAEPFVVVEPFHNAKFCFQS